MNNSEPNDIPAPNTSAPTPPPVLDEVEQRFQEFSRVLIALADKQEPEDEVTRQFLAECEASIGDIRNTITTVLKGLSEAIYQYVDEQFEQNPESDCRYDDPKFTRRLRAWKKLSDTRNMICTKHGDMTGDLETMNGLGNIYYNLGMYDEALEELNGAKTLATQLDGSEIDGTKLDTKPWIERINSGIARVEKALAESNAQE